MKQIQIICDPSDWDASVISGCGLNYKGRTLLPQRRVASDLPEPFLSVWRGLVAQLKSLAPGEWAAQFIVATRTERDDTPAPTDAEPTPELIITPIVHMTIYRQWDDGTTAEPVTVDTDDARALELFDFLTQSSAYDD